jgi:hypothetical protein
LPLADLVKVVDIQWNTGVGRYPSHGVWCENFIPLFQNDNLMLKQLAEAAGGRMWLV